MAAHVYLVFQLPGQPKEFFVREAEKSINGRNLILPKLRPTSSTDTVLMPTAP